MVLIPFSAKSAGPAWRGGGARSFLEKSIVFGYKELQRIHRDPERSVFFGQAYTGTRRMPWHHQATKDAANCEQPRGAVAGFDPRVSEWGNPAGAFPPSGPESNRVRKPHPGK